MTARHAAALLAAAAVLVPAASAHGARVTAALSVEEVVPATPAGVTFAPEGRLAGTLRADGRLTWRLTHSGTTGTVTAAHLRLGARGATGRVVAVLCAPCGRTIPTRSARLPVAVAAAVRNGRAYVELVTAANPGGELRGQVVVALRAGLRQLPSHPPRTETRGVRAFTGILEGRRLDWDLVLQGIEGKVTRAEVRDGDTPVRVLCAPCRTRTTGAWALSAGQNRLLRAGRLTVWIATAGDPAGYAARRIVVG